MMTLKDLDESTRSRLSAIRLVTLDVDGVLTDGRITYTSDGNEVKSFHVHDGQGIKKLLDAGIQVAFISSRESSMTSRRAEELNVSFVYQGARDKIVCLREIVKILGIELNTVAHVGDDINDQALFNMVGLGVAVADAVPGVREKADLLLTLGGGMGAVRELSDLLLSTQSS